jgi:hypothetical protein
MTDEKKTPPKEFDRVEYMKTLRREVLEKLDLPENTKPERVLLMVKIKEEMAKIRKEGGKNH